MNERPNLSAMHGPGMAESPLYTYMCIRLYKMILLRIENWTACYAQTRPNLHSQQVSICNRLYCPTLYVAWYIQCWTVQPVTD